MEDDGSTNLPTPPTTATLDVQSSSLPSTQQSDVLPSSSQTQATLDPSLSSAGTVQGGEQPAPLPPPPVQPLDLTVDILIQRIVLLSATQDHAQLASYLREIQGRESLFLQSTSSGEDPLSLLDPTVHTLGMLYIMTARLFVAQHIAPPVPLPLISEFCRRFDPEQMRYAPDRVTHFAKGVLHYAEMRSVKAAIAPLYDLLTRFAPDLTYLTTIHQFFITACISSQHYTPALPIITTPISNISLGLCPDLAYTDHIVYHYLAGVAAAALRDWDLAADLLEKCTSAPVGRGNHGGGPIGASAPGGAQMGGAGMVGMSMRGDTRAMRGVGPGVVTGAEPSAVQADAMKKLVLVQLVQHGQLLPVTRYTNAVIARIAGQGSPYGAFARAYPSQLGTMQQVVEKEQATFVSDGNMGLVKLALARAPRWTIKKLTETYLTLGLAEIGRAVGIDDVEEVRRMVLSMIDAGEINATISADGTVAFADDPPARVSKAEMDAVLARAQAQERALRILEREMAQSREYLSKAVRNRDDGGAAWGQTEETSEWGTVTWNDDAFSNL